MWLIFVAYIIYTSDSGWFRSLMEKKKIHIININEVPSLWQTVCYVLENHTE